MQMGVAVGTHVGPGGVSLFFAEKDKLKDNMFLSEMEPLIQKKNEFLQKFKNKK